jgi:hypothetical protein
MSNAEIIALIDAVLALPVSDTTKNDLRSFRTQVQAGTIAEDDRNYIINLCKRLQTPKKESYSPSDLNAETRAREAEIKAREDAEARRKRIECRHRTGEIFKSTADLKWLYFELGLRGALEEWQTERDLEDFLREPIWESLWNGNERINDLTKQAARYIDNPQYHCTALRDFFIIRLTENLLMQIRDPIRDRPLTVLRPLLAGFLIAMAIILYLFVSWQQLRSSCY